MPLWVQTVSQGVPKHIPAPDMYNDSVGRFGTGLAMDFKNVFNLTPKPFMFFKAERKSSKTINLKFKYKHKTYILF